MGFVPGLELVRWGVLVVVCLLVAAVEALLHWFPWERAASWAVGAPWSYVGGLVPILAGFSAWGLAFGYWEAVVGVWLVTGCAGAAVMLCYLTDTALGGNLAQRAVRSRESE